MSLLRLRVSKMRCCLHRACYGWHPFCSLCFHNWWCCVLSVVGVPAVLWLVFLLFLTFLLLLAFCCWWGPVSALFCFFFISLHFHFRFRFRFWLVLFYAKRRNDFSFYFAHIASKSQTNGTPYTWLLLYYLLVIPFLTRSYRLLDAKLKNIK